MKVTDSVWTIVRELHRAAQLQRRAAARSPLGPVALGLLNLAAQGPVRPSAAAAELDVPAPTLTRATGDLAAAGLARRVADESDGRSYVIELTDEGRTACGRFREEVAGQFSRLLGDWSDAEIVDFAGRLERLVTAMHADVPPEPERTSTPNTWRRS